MATIEERCRRNSPEDQIYLGDLVERALTGEFGTLMRQVITGFQAEWLAESPRSTQPADRILGRLEGINQVVDRLEWMIINKQRMTEESEKAHKVGPQPEPGNQGT